MLSSSNCSGRVASHSLSTATLNQYPSLHLPQISSSTSNLAFSGGLCSSGSRNTPLRFSSSNPFTRSLFFQWSYSSKGMESSIASNFAVLAAAQPLQDADQLIGSVETFTSTAMEIYGKGIV